jgi:hypothetical protein
MLYGIKRVSKVKLTYTTFNAYLFYETDTKIEGRMCQKLC